MQRHRCSKNSSPRAGSFAPSAVTQEISSAPSSSVVISAHQINPTQDTIKSQECKICLWNSSITSKWQNKEWQATQVTSSSLSLVQKHLHNLGRINQLPHHWEAIACRRGLRKNRKFYSNEDSQRLTIQTTILTRRKLRTRLRLLAPTYLPPLPAMDSTVTTFSAKYSPTNRRNLPLRQQLDWNRAQKAWTPSIERAWTSLVKCRLL